MPSQHGIGDYSKMPWNFDNYVINNQIINLPKILKSEGFLIFLVVRNQDLVQK